MLVLKAAAIWLLILVLAVLNGGFREAVLLPSVGEPLAFVLSGILLSLCIVVVSLVLVPRVGRLTTTQSLNLGLLWVVLTLMFEFSFGRVIQGRPWSELLQAYTFRDGNIWPLVLVVTFFAPLLAVRFGKRRPGVPHNGADT